MKRYFTPGVFLTAGAWAVILAGLWMAVLRGVTGGQLQAVAIVLAILFFLPMLAVPAVLVDAPAAQRGLMISLLGDFTLFSLALLVALTPLSARDALAACGVIFGWTLAVMGFAKLLSVVGDGIAASGALAVHTLCYAALMVTPPAFRGLPVAWHERIAVLVGWICPGLALQEATRDSLAFNWPQMDVMYALTTFSQDVPLSVPTWWHAAVMYAGAGVVMMAAGWGMDRIFGRHLEN